MPAFSADYYDGRHSTRHRVDVEVEGESLRIRGGDVQLEYRLSDLTYSQRLGGTPLRVGLPGGGVLVTSQAAAAHLPVPPSHGLAHRLESHRGIVLAALAGLIVAGWLAYQYGVPWVAREVAARLPADIEKELGAQSLGTLDRLAFGPSALEPERQDRLRSHFATLAQAAGLAGVRLEFRHGNWIGPNALAIPGAVVVVTDELTGLLDDERVLAVLAHELGHHRHRHGLRHVLQDSMVALGTMTLFGDASSAATVAATLPTVLVHGGYSREFEREADAFAFDLLARTGRSPQLLAAALETLEQSLGGERSGRDEAPDYFSTHPGLQERIRAAREAASERKP